MEQLASLLQDTRRLKHRKGRPSRNVPKRKPVRKRTLERKEKRRLKKQRKAVHRELTKAKNGTKKKQNEKSKTPKDRKHQVEAKNMREKAGDIRKPRREGIIPDAEVEEIEYLERKLG
eukprot:525146-Amorphochlora_amoeboformis.AAC.3